MKVPQLLDAASNIVVGTHLCESLFIKLKVHSGCSFSFARSGLLTGYCREVVLFAYLSCVLTPSLHLDLTDTVCLVAA